MPITWAFALLLVGLIWKYKSTGKKLIWSSLLVFYLFSNQFIFNSVVGSWEPAMTDFNEIEGKYQYAVILGGYSVYSPEVNQVNFSEAADRYTAVIQLYNRGIAKKIILCGGQGNIFGFTETEGVYMGRHMQSLGIPKRDIIVEGRSQNTYQNAVECKKILDSLNVKEPVLLITSTTHMNRSSACFKKQNIDHIPILVDGCTGPHKWLFDFLFLPDSYTLFAWNKIIHEWMGLLVYKIAGYI